ncbi:hypothetical protein FRB93_005920 [Tulasnella sp. JGI-2019a]|nr:hypothetical protein FRB93_005920 [Tulasnella sp. JGI-2019a]
MANVECLARSNQVPLHILLRYPIFHHLACHEFKTKILQEVHRWKCAEISVTSVELFHQPAPLLEILEIEGNMEGAPVACNLFGGSASRLRHLTLVNIIIPWDSSLFSHLRTLRIRHVQNYSPSVQQIVHVLQSCPDLTTFDLHLRPELHPGLIPLEASTVELPRLEHLSIRVHPLMTEHLLRRMRIPSCKIFHIINVEATGPTLSSSINHLIPSLTSILLTASMMNIDITSSTLEYEATVEVDEDDEGEGGNTSKPIIIHASGDQFTEEFVLKTLSWLVDNLHTPSITSPVSLNIRGITSSHAMTHIIDRLSSVITNLNLQLTDETSAKAIVSYLAEPFQDGTTKLRWPLPKLTDLSFGGCDDLKPEVILGYIQRRAGHGLFWEGQSEDHKELPARLNRLGLPPGFSTAGLLELFPDCMEWSGLDPEDLEDDERHHRSRLIHVVEDISDDDLRLMEENLGIRSRRRRPWGGLSEPGEDSD